MAKRDILKEAIADAKAVKETAIANAKAALEEAFTPQLKSMLSAKLEEMELDEKKEYSDDDREPAKDEYKPEKDTVDRKMMENEDIEEEINLDELLNEIESELEEEELVTEESEAERADVDKYEYEEGKEEGEEDMMDAESTDLDLEDMTDEDLKSFIEDVIADMVSSGELEAGDEFEEVETEETEVMSDDSDDSEEIDIEIEDDETVEVNEDDSLAEVYKEVSRLKEDLKKSNSTVNTLKHEINEVNLLNAKLLYTNKIFKAKSLTENEKVKVLGAFDKATTVKETKLVFETLNEGLKKKKAPIRESLGSASKATGNFKTKKPIIAADPMVERFQKLAGLK
tara:strand:+ start:1681 stop:2706 length:1026 start_codon:yes stop_codon:yes gene_type:complete